MRMRKGGYGGGKQSAGSRDGGRKGRAGPARHSEAREGRPGGAAHRPARGAAPRVDNRGDFRADKRGDKRGPKRDSKPASRTESFRGPKSGATSDRKFAPKRDHQRPGDKGRAYPARPPREQPVAVAPAPAPVVAPKPKPVHFSAGVQTLTVTPDENGMRVDRFFEAKFPGLSFSHIQRIIRKGEVRVNGKRTEPKSRLEACLL